MENKLFETILNSTFAKKDLIKRLEALKVYIDIKLFSPNQDPSEKIDPEDLSWLQSLPKEFYQAFTNQSYQGLLASLNKQTEELKTLVVYLATEFPEDEIVKLSQHLRLSYGNRFLIDIKLDPNLIAGAALVWNGVYRDYSLKSKIEQNKQDIISSFRSFIK